MTATLERARWRFGDFELTAGVELRRQGHPVVLGRRALDLLGVLVAEQGRLVSRADLQRRLWPRSVVVDNALHQHVRALRQALGPHAELVETVSGQGYRFMGAAEPVHDEPPGAVGPADRPRPGGAPLPEALTALVGRDQALGSLRALWPQRRLVTLLGPGGVGKTRLALALAHTVQTEGMPVTWVDLAGVGADADVDAAIGAAFGLRGDSQQPTLQRLLPALGHGRVGLVLDNCEHVAEGCAAAVAYLLRHAASLHLLATSQRPLGLPGEHRWRVPALGLPAAGADAGTGEAASLRLLRQRVEEAQGHPMRLHGAALAEAATLCRRLDGNPLAIELVAARVAAVGLTATLAAIADQVRLLRFVGPAGPPKQRSLQATLEWSHGLLTPALQSVWRRLSVFHGSFSHAAATAMMMAEGSASPLSPDESLAALAELVDRSLVQADTDADEPRFRLLDVQRLFADQQLVRQGEHRTLARQHALYFAGRFEQAAAQWDRTSDAAWLAAYGVDSDNLRAALRAALAQHDRPLAARLAAASVPLWRALGTPHELRRLLEHPLLQPSDRAPLADEAGLELARAMSLIVDAADKQQLLESATRAVQACAAASWRLGQAQALLCLALANARFANPGPQGQALDQALDLLDGHRFGKTWGWYCHSRAWHWQLGGSPAQALDWVQAARQAYRDCGAAQGEAQASMHLADLQLALGDSEASIATGEALLKLLDDRYPREWRGRTLANLGAAYRAAGALDRADALLVQALDALRGLDFSYWVFDHLAPMALTRGRADLAARMVGHADAGYAHHRGGLRLQNEAAVHGRTMTALRACLSPPALSSLLATGARDSEDDLRACLATLSAPITGPVSLTSPAAPAPSAPDSAGAIDATQGRAAS